MDDSNCMKKVELLVDFEVLHHLLWIVIVWGWGNLLLVVSIWARFTIANQSFIFVIFRLCSFLSLLLSFSLFDNSVQAKMNNLSRIFYVLWNVFIIEVFPQTNHLVFFNCAKFSNRHFFLFSQESSWNNR